MRLSRAAWLLCFCLACLVGGAWAEDEALEFDSEAASELLLTKPDNPAYAACLADVLINFMLENHLRDLPLVRPALFAKLSAPQSLLGRYLVAEQRRKWDFAMSDLLGLLQRRGWLEAALSPSGALVPMSVEHDDDQLLIGYVSPLLNRRELGGCIVPPREPVVCFAEIRLARQGATGFELLSLQVKDAEGQPVILPPWQRESLADEGE